MQTNPFHFSTNSTDGQTSLAEPTRTAATTGKRWGAVAAFSLACASLLLVPIAHGHSPAAHGGSGGKAASAAQALPPLPEAFAAANKRLHESTAQLRGRAAILAEGDPVPAFALYDENAKPVLVPNQWQGKHIVISFIFTRCKMPAMCPAATAKMTSMQRTLDEKGLGGDVQFISLSFDPRYDTPQVLRQYANLFGAKPGNYSFLTGSEVTVNDVLRRFGVILQEEDGTINHSMVTVLIDPFGNVASRQIGADWQTEPFLKQIERAAHAALPTESLHASAAGGVQ